MRRVFMSILVVTVILGLLISGISCAKIVIPTPSPSPTPMVTPTPTVVPTPTPIPTPRRFSDVSTLSGKSWSELKEMAISPSYDDLLRNNEYYIDVLVYYLGQVVQVKLVGGDKYRLTVHIKKGEDYWTDTVYLYYINSQIREGDIIEFVGIVEGLISDTADSGNTINIPYINVVMTRSSPLLM